MLFKLTQLPGKQFERVPAKSVHCTGCAFFKDDFDLCPYAKCTPRGGTMYTIKEVGVDYGKGARRYGDPIVPGRVYKHHGSEKSPIPNGYFVRLRFASGNCWTSGCTSNAETMRWTHEYNPPAGGDIVEYAVFNTSQEARNFNPNGGK